MFKKTYLVDDTPGSISNIYEIKILICRILNEFKSKITKDQLCTPPALRPLFSKGEIVIGKNVWICDKATITAGVTIGNGCIIAANAVVTKSIPPYSLAAGNPAKVVKTFKKDDNE